MNNNNNNYPRFFIYENIIDYGERRYDLRICEQLRTRKNSEVTEQARRFLAFIARYRFSLKAIIANEESDRRFCRGSGMTISAGIGPIFTDVNYSDMSITPETLIPSHYTPFQSCRNIRRARYGI